MLLQEGFGVVNRLLGSVAAHSHKLPELLMQVEALFGRVADALHLPALISMIMPWGKGGGSGAGAADDEFSDTALLIVLVVVLLLVLRARQQRAAARAAPAQQPQQAPQQDQGVRGAAPWGGNAQGGVRGPDQ